MNKLIPNLADRKEACCGCGACYLICPTKAIQMLEDEEGFEYPYINEDKCIACYLCVKTCAFKKDQESKKLNG